MTSEASGALSTGWGVIFAWEGKGHNPSPLGLLDPTTPFYSCRKKTGFGGSGRESGSDEENRSEPLNRLRCETTKTKISVTKKMVVS